MVTSEEFLKKKAEAMDCNPLLSIVIPAFNAEQTLVRAVSSIVQDKSLQVEVVIVNDGSTDETKGLALALTKADRRVVILDQPNRGVSSARNAGMAQAKGAYIGFLDADDVVLQGALKGVLDTLAERTPDCLRVDYKGDSAKRSRLTLRPGTYSEVFEKDKLLGALMAGDLPGYSWLLVIRKEIVKLVAFREDIPYMEDLLFTFDVISLSQSLEIIDLPVVRYLANEFGATRNPKHFYRNLTATIAVEDVVYERLGSAQLSTSLRQTIASRRLSALGVLLVLASREASFNRDEFFSVSMRMRKSTGVLGLTALLPKAHLRRPWVVPVILVAAGRTSLAFWCTRAISAMHRAKSVVRTLTRKLVT